MKKTCIFFLIIISGLYLTCQQTGESFVLDDPIPSNQTREWVASEYISLQPNFEADPHPGYHVQASIDPYMVIPPGGDEGGPNPDDDGVVGAIPGSLNVPVTGAAIYTIPIELPAGISGMTPKLALVYNSQSSSPTILGPKWGISGFSSINRASPTKYYNNEDDNIDFENDQFTLNGSKLIKVFENADSIIYRTEIDKISKIVYYTNSGNSLPYDYYKIQTLSGLEKEYGNSLDSRQVYDPGRQNSNEEPLVWHLSKEKDKKGNFIHYEYIRDVENGELHPNAIYYTGHEERGTITQAPFYKVSFVYDTLPERLRRMNYYLKNNNVYLNRNACLLKTIKLYYNETTEIKKYGFEYDELMSATKETFLSQVTESVYQGNNQYIHTNPTKIHWEYYSPEYTINSISTGNTKLHEDYLRHPMLSADINGDGKKEVVTGVYDLYTSKKFYIRIYTDKNLLRVTMTDFVDFTFSDFNNDGTDELLIIAKNSIFIYDFIYNNSTELYSTVRVKTLSAGDIQVPIDSETSVSAIDFNGDKVYDLAINYKNSIISFLEGVRESWDFNHSTNFNVPTEYELKTYSDFTGDGKTDILIGKDSTFSKSSVEFYTYSYDGESFSESSHHSNTSFTYCGHYMYGDFNGDGKTDIFNQIGAGAIKTTLFSYGSGFVESDSIIMDGVKYGLENYQSVYLNSDYRTDIISLTGYWNNLTIVGFFTQPDGKHYRSQVLKQIDMNEGRADNYTVGDFNGDNLPDIAVEIAIPSSTPGVYNTVIKIFYYTPNSGFVLDLVGGITNGFGEKTIINYQPFSYSSTGNPQYTFPLSKTVRRSFTVASTWVVRETNQSNRFRQKYYQYYRPISHMDGKGFLCFEEVAVKDYHNRIETIKSYGIYSVNNKYFFPYVDTIQQFSLSFQYERNQKLKQTINSYTHKNTIAGNTYIYKPIMLQSFSKIWDNDENHTFIKTEKTIIDEPSIDIYGNIKSATSLSDTDELSFSDPENMYDYKTVVHNNFLVPNENAWLVNMLQNTTRTKSYVNDPVSDKMYNEFDYYSIGQPGYPSVNSISNTPNSSNQHRTETWYTYDEFGNTTTETLKVPNASPSIDDKVTYYDYSGNNNYEHRFLTETRVVADDADYVQTFEYDIFSGNLTSETNISGLTTSYKYDPFGRLYKITLPDGNQNVSVWRWSEDHPDAPFGSLFYLWSKISGTAEQSVFYNKYGEKYREVNIGLDENKKIYKDYRYSAKGINYRVSDPYFSNTTAQSWHRKQFDYLGRVVRLSSPNKNIKYTYAGNQLTTTNLQTEKSVSKTVNALQQLEKVIDPTGTVSYTYYSSGNVKQVHSVDSYIYYSYDPAGHQDSIIDPDLGTTISNINPLGQVIKQVDGKLNAYKYSYDQLNRIKSIALLNNNDVTTCNYNTTEGENGFGMIKNVIGADNITYFYNYDQYNRLNNYKEIIDGQPFSYDYEYDILGRLKIQSYPSGFTIKNFYNKNGYLGKIKNNENSKVLWEAKQMNARGQFESYELGNGLTTYKEYDEFGLPKKIQTGNIQDLEFDVNPHTGNLNWRKDHKHSLTESFTYDTDKLNNRLTGWHVQGQIAYTTSYQNNGNITTKSDITRPGGSFVYNTGTKPHAVTTITQPTEEYMAVAYPETIEYTAFNKVSYILQEYETKGVSDVHELFIHYGPAYQRKKTEQFLNNELTKRKYFIGGNYEIEIDGHGNEKKLHYLYAGDGLFAIYEKYNNKEEMYYIHKDYLGSYQSITNAEGNLVEELSFDPWGRRRNPTDWSFNNVPESYLFDRGYTGHEHLNDFNLINMNGRMYDPYVARFLSPDPFIQAPDYTQSYNRYSYVVNNPLKYVDPSGYDWISTGTQTGYFYIAEVTDQESLDKYIEDTGDYSGSTYLFAEGIVNSPNYCSLWLKADGTKEGLLDEVEIFANGNYGVNMADWRQLLGSMQGQAGGGDDYSLFFDGSAGGESFWDALFDYEQNAGMIVYGGHDGNDGPGGGYTAKHQYRSINLAILAKFGADLKNLFSPPTNTPHGFNTINEIGWDSVWYDSDSGNVAPYMGDAKRIEYYLDGNKLDSIRWDY